VLMASSFKTSPGVSFPPIAIPQFRQPPPNCIPYLNSPPVATSPFFSSFAERRRPPHSSFAHDLAHPSRAARPLQNTYTFAAALALLCPTLSRRPSLTLPSPHLTSPNLTTAPYWQ
jgi:hypothetical protein